MWQKGAVNLDGVLTPPQETGDDAGDTSSEPALAPPVPCQPLAEKELKRIAFSLCQYHYEEILPLVSRLAELEDSVGEQEDDQGRGASGKSKGGSRGKSSRKG
jgi:hypothetical protein